MSKLEYITHEPHRCNVIEDKINWTKVSGAVTIECLPQIFWEDGAPWREVNLWALERATEGDVLIKTISSNFLGLLDYANWLEESKSNWRDFPVRKADRCIFRFRKKLIELRDEGSLAPSTASQRMSSVILFYRWAHSVGLFSTSWPIWLNKSVPLKIIDSIGFERTILVNSNDLSIKNRKIIGDQLEDGLLPVSSDDRDTIITFTKKNKSYELFLMLSIGFFTGMRLGTISDLRIETLERATQDPASKDLFRLSVGPGADPPVDTKFGVTGQVWITRVLLEELKAYFYSVIRLIRQSKSSPQNRNLIFLTRFGNPYSVRGSNESSAINVEMHKLRNLALSKGLTAFRNFKFHQTRCTFATELTSLAINHGGALLALPIVRDALLHRDEATTLKYIKFIQKTPAKIAVANAFSEAFFGIFKTT
jgi:integrase